MQACLLLSQEAHYPPAYQLALDMMKVLLSASCVFPISLHHLVPFIFMQVSKSNLQRLSLQSPLGASAEEIQDALLSKNHVINPARG